MTLDGHAHGVQADELAGHVADRPADAPLGSHPVAGAQAVHPGRLAADVLRHDADLIRGHVQTVALRVLQEQVVALRAGHRAPDHPHVPADAVHLMDAQVARFQLRRNGFGASLRQSRRLARVAAPAEQVLLGEERHPAAFEREPLLDVGADARDLAGREAGGLEDLERAIEAAPSLGRDHDAGSGPVQTGRLGGEHRPAVAGGLPRPDAEVGSLRQLGDVDAVAAAEGGLRFLDHADARPLGRLRQRVRLQNDLGRTVDGEARMRQDDRRRRGQQIGEERQAVVQERDGLLHPLEREAVGQALENGAVLAANGGAVQRLRRALPRVPVHHELPARVNGRGARSCRSTAVSRERTRAATRSRRRRTRRARAGGRSRGRRRGCRRGRRTRRGAPRRPRASTRARSGLRAGRRTRWCGPGRSRAARARRDRERPAAARPGWVRRRRGGPSCFGGARRRRRGGPRSAVRG